jgi:hypothetical protein
MIAVGLAEMAGDAVIYVLTVWHGLVAATGAVHMARLALTVAGCPRPRVCSSLFFWLGGGARNGKRSDFALRQRYGGIGAGCTRIGVLPAFACVVTDTLRALATQQMPAYHKQIGQRAGHEQAMGVLLQPGAGLYVRLLSFSAQALATAEFGALLPGMVAQPPFSMRARRSQDEKTLLNATSFAAESVCCWNFST